MESFVLANIAHRRTRSIVTMLGVALGVVLVTLTTGLARGQLAERGRREASAGAEILVRPAGSGLNAVTATLSMDLSVVPSLAAVEGVQSVVPLGQFIERSEGGAFGFRSIDGINYDEYAAMSALKIVAGRPMQGPNEAIVDEVQAKKPEGRLGQSVDFGGSKFTIVGVYSPESMSRVKIPLSAMQAYFDAQGYASMLMVKVAPGADVDQVALRVREALPDNQILLARDLPSFYARGIPALNTFLRVVTGLAVVISTLVIMLTMYTTVIERTRQIGILKSLGASRSFIAFEIEKEALVISAAGVVLGYVVALTAAAVLRRATTLQIEFEAAQFVVTGVVGVASGVIGALYPAVRAAKLDPVRALAYE